MKVLSMTLMLALALTACADEPSDTISTSPTAQQTGSGSPTPDRPVPQGGTGDPEVNERGSVDKTGSNRVEMSMKLDNDFFKPTFIRIDEGARLSLKIENTGDKTHTFTSEKLNVDESLEPGDKKNLDFSVQGDGTVAFFCKIHSGQGMIGEFRLT